MTARLCAFMDSYLLVLRMLKISRKFITVYYALDKLFCLHPPGQPRGQRKKCVIKKGGALENEVKNGRALENEVKKGRALENKVKKGRTLEKEGIKVID